MTEVLLLEVEGVNELLQDCVEFLDLVHLLQVVVPLGDVLEAALQLGCMMLGNEGQYGRDLGVDHDVDYGQIVRGHESRVLKPLLEAF